MKRVTALCFAAVVALAVAPLAAQEHGGGVGCGDVFGDLVHVQRDATTGQPILARRFVELPADVPGYGWGYCTIALYHPEDPVTGEIRTDLWAEASFLPYSCDYDLDADDDGVEEIDLVEVDYFGRLSGGRTKEKNHRMHFNEVISNIKMAGYVKQEAASGRLLLGYDCTLNGGGKVKCDEWGVIDSPMESMALYTRAMKYGHFQTDPEEFDLWTHGDPAAVPPFNPALDPNDWAKFHQSVRHLLPMGGNAALCFPGWDLDGVYEAPEAYVDENANGEYDFGEPFADANVDGVRNAGDPFNPACAATEPLGDRDFIRAGSFLGAAANKTGIITVDLVQYMNRILKITKTTEATLPTQDTLPALVRDCEDVTETYAPPDETDPDPVDPGYLPLEACSVYAANSALENYSVFPDVQEKFVDFSALQGDGIFYEREEWREEEFPELILPLGGEESTTWELAENVNVLGWLEYANGPDLGLGNIDGFVAAASDALRTIEFIHNYAVPVYLPYEAP